MRDVTVEKKELLRIAKENKEIHNTIYQAALEGYFKQTAKVLREKLRDINQNKKIDNCLILPLPENHEANYNRVIRMLELSIDDMITLDEDSFSEIVLNEWDWKNSFKSSNSRYMGFTGYTGPAGSRGATESSLQDAFNKF